MNCYTLYEHKHRCFSHTHMIMVVIIIIHQIMHSTFSIIFIVIIRFLLCSCAWHGIYMLKHQQTQKIQNLLIPQQNVLVGRRFKLNAISDEEWSKRRRKDRATVACKMHMLVYNIIIGMRHKVYFASMILAPRFYAYMRERWLAAAAEANTQILPINHIFTTTGVSFDLSCCLFSFRLNTICTRMYENIYRIYC